MAKHNETLLILDIAKERTNVSAITVNNAISDLLITAKLTFFSFVTSKIEPYFTKPLPLMYRELKRAVKSIMDMVVKPEI